MGLIFLTNDNPAFAVGFTPGFILAAYSVGSLFCFIKTFCIWNRFSFKCRLEVLSWKFLANKDIIKKAATTRRAHRFSFFRKRKS